MYAVAGKDRSAILTAGHDAQAAYWWHRGQGRFVTSSHYRSDPPRWVDIFNRGSLPDSLARVGWTRDGGPTSALADRRPGEDDGRSATFPHPPASEDGQGWPTALMLTPYGDELLFRFAERLVEAEGLSADRTPDLLWLGGSGADFIGHYYGPESVEVAEYYAHLDRMLGRFMDGLDRRVGQGEWTLAVSSDHGVQPLPETLRSRGDDAGRLRPDSLAVHVRAALARSHYPGRSPDLWMVPAEGWLLSSGDARTAHLTPHDYDTRIPLLLYGLDPVRVCAVRSLPHELGGVRSDQARQPSSGRQLRGGKLAGGDHEQAVCFSRLAVPRARKEAGEGRGPLRRVWSGHRSSSAQVRCRRRRSSGTSSRSTQYALALPNVG